MRTSVFCAAGMAALLICGCGQNPATEAARDHSDRLAALPYEDRAPAREADAPRTERVPTRETTARAPAPLFQGRPMWSDSRKYSAEENARYQFDHHAAELGAKNLDDFIAKAHDFTASPPKGAMKAVRANGDTLLYDPKSGLFAVARSDGAPRTLFKPEDGEAYWKAQQKDSSASARRTRSDDAG